MNLERKVYLKTGLTRPRPIYNVAPYPQGGFGGPYPYGNYSYNYYYPRPY